MGGPRAPVALALFAWTVFSLGGCGSDDDDAAQDASSPGDDGGEATNVTPPDIPWLEAGAPPIAGPALTPCPDGWREIPADESSDPATCDPYPEDGALDCPPGQAHFVGEPGCAPVGAPCPPGPFAADLPTDRRVVYVQSGAVGGDGSLAMPHASLSEFSVGGLPMGTVIALSTGSHDGPLRVSRDHVVQGACAAATLVRTTVPHTAEGTLTFLGVGGTVRDLTIGDSPRPGVWISMSGTVGRLEGVGVSNAQAFGIHVTRAARLSARSVVVRDTAARSDGGFGYGLHVELGSTAEVSRAVVSGNHVSGVFATDAGTTLTASDVDVSETLSRVRDGLFGRGLSVEDGGAVTVDRALFSRNHDVGVFAFEDASLALTDAVIRDTLSEVSDRTGGRGLGIERGATVTSSRLTSSGNREVGVFVAREGTVLTATDVVVRDTAGRESDGGSGTGLDIEHGAHVDVGRCWLSRNRGFGVFVSRAGSTLTMTDAVVSDTASRSADGLFGRGIGVQLGATAEVDRALVERNRELGVFASESGTMVTLTDLVVRDTAGRTGDGAFGRGLGVQLGAGAIVSRALFSGNRDVGVLAHEMGSAVTASDIVIRDTEAGADGGGRGLHVQLGATAELSRVVCDANRELGVAATLAGRATLMDLVVSGTRPRACAETTCAGSGAGHGVVSYRPGTMVRMTRFAVRDNTLCGVQVADRAGLDAELGEVVRQPIGACVQVAGYDTSRLTRSVRYEDNGVNLQATDLPLPDALEPTALTGP